MNRTSAPVRVFSVDDHPIICESIQGLCMSTEGYEACGAASTIDEAIALIPQARPDIVVLDLELHGRSGHELLRQLRRDHPQIRALVFSMHEEARHALAAIKEGARGYVMKSSTPGEVLAAIREVSQGRLAVGEEIQQKILAETVRGTAQARRPDQILSMREWQVFECLGKGRSVKQVAAELQISEKTVNSYCERVKEKLDLPRLRDVVRLAHEWILGKSGDVVS